MSRSAFWTNQIFFQLAWPACVVGAALGQLWPSLFLVGLFAFWQLSPARRHPADWSTVLMFVACGLILDTLWQQLGVVRYTLPWPVAGMVPIWLLSLWVALALTVNHSLAIFKQRWSLFAVAASVGSPLSYLAASRVGAVEWVAPPWVVILCLGPVWALIVSLLFYLSSRIERRLQMRQEMALDGVIR